MIKDAVTKAAERENTTSQSDALKIQAGIVSQFRNSEFSGATGEVLQTCLDKYVDFCKIGKLGGQDRFKHLSEFYRSVVSSL
jgi:hypothetical protein